MFSNKLLKINKSMLSKLAKKGFTNQLTHVNFLKLSRQFKKLTFPFEEGKTAKIIYYKDNDKIGNIINRVNETGKNSILITNIEGKEFDKELPFNSITKEVFIIHFNSQIKNYYFPYIKPIIENNVQLSNSEVTNEYLLFNFSKYINNRHNSKNFHESLFQELDNLVQIYEKMLSEFNEKQRVIETKLKRTSNFYSYLVILYLVLHLVLFYALIYHMYGWDVVEPVTYLVQNFYWIIGLSFFLSKKHRFEISYFLSSGFLNRFFHKNNKIIAYSKKNHEFIKKELAYINTFKRSLKNQNK